MRTVCGRLSRSRTRSLIQGPNNFALYASELSTAITCPTCSPIILRKLSSLSTWHKSAICIHTGKSSWSATCGDSESRCGLQLEKVIGVVSQTRSVWVRAWILPSGVLNVTSNKLLALSARNIRDGYRFSWAQAMRALSPGCLPCILPNKERLVFAAQVARSVVRTASGIAALSWRVHGCLSNGGSVGSLSAIVLIFAEDGEDLIPCGSI